MKVHLVIPCLNESGRIPRFLGELCAEMEAIGNVNILVIDDGSDEDETRRMNAIIESFREQYACLQKLHHLEKNLGKGAAVYAGWASHYDSTWLAFVDADGSCSAKETARMIQHARGNPRTALFASRVKMLGYDVQRLLKRHLIGRIYATIVSELLNIPVYDSQCGLKIIPVVAYDEIQNNLTINGFAFDVDLLVHLLEAGYQVREFPINWHEEQNGKVRLLRDSWCMFRDVWSIRRKRRSQ